MVLVVFKQCQDLVLTRFKNVLSATCWWLTIYSFQYVGPFITGLKHPHFYSHESGLVSILKLWTVAMQGA